MFGVYIDEVGKSTNFYSIGTRFAKTRCKCLLNVKTTSPRIGI